MALLFFIIDMVISALKWLKIICIHTFKKIKWFTGPLQTSMMGFTWKWESHFWKKKFDGFINIFKIIRKLENCKNTYVQTQRSSKTDKNFPREGWVIVEKIGFYKLFPIQKVISFTLICAEVVEAILIFDVPPEHGSASALRSRGCRSSKQNVELKKLFMLYLLPRQWRHKCLL